MVNGIEQIVQLMVKLIRGCKIINAAGRDMPSGEGRISF